MRFTQCVSLAWASAAQLTRIQREPGDTSAAAIAATNELVNTAKELYRNMDQLHRKVGSNPGEGIPDDDEYWSTFPPHIRTFVRAVSLSYRTPLTVSRRLKRCTLSPSRWYSLVGGTSKDPIPTCLSTRACSWTLHSIVRSKRPLQRSRRCPMEVLPRHPTYRLPRHRRLPGRIMSRWICSRRTRRKATRLKAGLRSLLHLALV